MLIHCAYCDAKIDDNVRHRRDVGIDFVVNENKKLRAALEEANRRLSDLTRECGHNDIDWSRDSSKLFLLANGPVPVPEGE